MRKWLEYAVVRVLVALLGSLPRGVARSIGAGVGVTAYRLLGRLRRVGLCNLNLAFPEKSPKERVQILRRLYRNLGWLLAEFCQMSHYTAENTRSFLRYDGLEHYLAARDRGKGVLIVTGHLGAWELSSYYHSLMGHPMSIVIRRLDNARVDQLVNAIRCLHGNRVLHKDDFARGLLAAMRHGETVGILMDTNMTPPQGLFVPFFGRQACTASGLARVALKTGAAVLPGFMLWEESEQKYVLRFGEEIPLLNTGDDEADALANTARFTAVIEDWVRRYPDQWLWVHRRWKTRPDGTREEAVQVSEHRKQNS
ncbi:MAG TPA: lysophospholipid acyltransferase family protein [Acidobacteriaceae bacterium]|nr:lysophospholipid acyltransferase family protein [Acidobacteriaceae bacterium]